MKRNALIIFVGILLLVIFFKDCSDRSGSNLVKTDTVRVVSRDTVYIKVTDTVKAEAKLITERDTINHYITVTDSCTHLNKRGIDLIKFRTYADTVDIKGYRVGYNASVLGRLESINLSLYGNVPVITETRTETITNTIEKRHSIGTYAMYNNQLIAGVKYNSGKFGYGVNYNLDHKSYGVYLEYNPFRW